MKRFLISFVSILLLTSVFCCSTFASGNSVNITKDYTITFKLDSDKWGQVNDWIDNPQNYVTLYSNQKSGSGYTLTDDYINTNKRVYLSSIYVIPIEEFKKLTFKKSDYFYSCSNIALNNCFGINCTIVNTDTLVVTDVLKTSSLACILGISCIDANMSNSSVVSQYSDITTDKIHLNIIKNNYTPPEPPKPPKPQVDTTYVPWYPSNGLDFFESHVKKTTGNVVTVSIWIFALILAIYVMIRVAKMFGKG